MTGPTFGDGHEFMRFRVFAGIMIQISIIGTFSDRPDGLPDAVPDGGIVHRFVEYDTPFLDIMGRQLIEGQGINILDIEGFGHIIGKLGEDIL